MSIDRRSRPSSVVGSESPSSKSSDSFKQPNARSANVLSSQHRSSIKKRSAPTVPPTKDEDSSSGNSGHSTSANNSQSQNHNRASSDSGGHHLNSFKQSHWRNYSADMTNDSVGYNNAVVSNVRNNPQSVSVFVTDNKSAQIYASAQRPRCPPPSAPDPINNCQSIESLPSLSSESEDCANRSHSVRQPVPPPRKVCLFLHSTAFD